jgi:glycosyltransferase involved in cell wall biosynthesis
VAFVCGDFPPTISGVGDYTAQLARALARRGHEVHVITSRLENVGGWSAPGVVVHRAVRSWRLRDLPFLLTGLQLLGHDTIVHVQYWCPAYGRRLLINVLPTALRLTRPACPVVVTVHEFRMHTLRWKCRVMPMVSSARGIVCVDPPDEPAVRRWVRFNRPLTQCIDIGSNIDPVVTDPHQRSSWRRALGFRDADPVAVFFGSIYAGKGFFDVVETVVRLRREGMRLQLLVVAGRAPEVAAAYERRALVALERLAGVDTQVILDAPPWRVSECLHLADVGIFPFELGAASNRGSLLAALEHGLPVITTRGVMTPPDFDERFGVALVPANNVDALSVAVRDVLASPARQAQMRTRSLAALANLSWDRIAEANSRLYEAVTATVGPGPAANTVTV